MCVNHEKTAPQFPSFDLSSQDLADQVLSALTRFTSEFGMGSGGATSLKKLENSRAVLNSLFYQYLIVNINLFAF